MFISNYWVSFPLRCKKKKNLVKRQKASKYYENDCLLRFPLLFMCLLTASIVIKSHSKTRICIIFLKNVLKQILTSLKISEKLLISKANFCTFLKLNYSILVRNCVKELRVTKILKEISFEGVREEPQEKKLFSETIIHKIFKTISRFHIK